VLVPLLIIFCTDLSSNRFGNRSNNKEIVKVNSNQTKNSLNNLFIKLIVIEAQVKLQLMQCNYSNLTIIITTTMIRIYIKEEFIIVSLNYYFKR